MTAKYALFVDMLGFADALDEIGQTGDDELPLDLFQHYLHLKQEQPTHRITRMYYSFHDTIHRTLAKKYDVPLDACLLFSDSVYIVTEDCRGALTLAQALLTACYWCELPVRIGIGRGTFATLAFTTENHPGGTIVADVPFLGSA